MCFWTKSKNKTTTTKQNIKQKSLSEPGVASSSCKIIAPKADALPLHHGVN